jgi:hypothetical protein
MKRIAAFFTLALAVGCGASFEEFSPDGKFKVLMPGTPKEDKRSALGIQITLWTVESRSGGWSIAVSGILPGVSLESSAQGQFAGMQGAITSQQKITLAGKYPGLQSEGTALSGKGHAITRIYHVGDRMYQMNVLGEKSFVSGGDATKFLESLQIISE